VTRINDSFVRAHNMIRWGHMFAIRWSHVGVLLCCVTSLSLISHLISESASDAVMLLYF